MLCVIETAEEMSERVKHTRRWRIPKILDQNPPEGEKMAPVDKERKEANAKMVSAFEKLTLNLTCFL